MINGRFAILGMENSGKTAFLSAFLAQMNQTKNFSVKSELISSSLNKNYADYHLHIYENQNEMISIDIADYTGAYFSSPDVHSVEYQRFSRMIFSADILYILIDGDLLCHGSIEDKIENVQMECSLFINPYISDYSEQNSGKLPVTFFVITKSYQVLRRNKPEDIHEILKLSFSNVFDSENIGSVEPYTICVDTKKNISVKIPFLTGIYYLLNKNRLHYESIKFLLENELQKYQHFMITDFRRGRLLIKIPPPDIHTVSLPSLIKIQPPDRHIARLPSAFLYVLICVGFIVLIAFLWKRFFSSA